MIAEHDFDPERAQDTSDPSGWPDALIPFVLSPVQAEEHFLLWRRKRRFVSRFFRHGALPVSIEPLYLPFWSFGADTNSFYTARRGLDRRFENTYTRTDSNGNSETYTETSTTTDYTPVSGEHGQTFEHLNVSASDVYDTRLLEKISDFDHAALEPWLPERTRGYRLTGSALSFPQGWAIGRKKIDQALAKKVTRRIGGDSVADLKLTIEFRRLRFRRVLLPFYRIDYEYRGRRMFSLLNGQTGTAAGDVPRSSMKIVLTIVAILAVVASVVYGLSR
ncbi:hypothetical protein [Saccharibacillus alkalitolerans]|uniref:Uncharacterized protein n=1 Tax=Saccharibacillus alkalitolerans TaxID=2705290 RepID=A0ABX0F8B5_9BACL|nr:hypothetical protein [Saccharibacillus alkalitolerans]NGZ77211.1 hypothetical protein [Saccharibacillus alkalitolerans]